MTTFRSGTTKDWPTATYPALLRYRYRVFIEKLGWDLRASDGMESDQFDRDDTVHVASHDRAGNINAYSRLLPTVKPYLLAEVFPELMDGGHLPCCDKTWELSRFTAHSADGACKPEGGTYFSPAAVALLHKSVIAARERGADNLIFVSSPGMATLMARADFNVQRIGNPQVIGGHRVLAARILF